MIFSVGRRRTFTDIRRDGLRVRHGAVRMSHLPAARLEPGSGSPQVAFALGRSFGKAVDRNRGRRRLRAAFVEVWQDQDPSRSEAMAGAFVLSGSRGLLTAPFAQLLADVEACFGRLATRLEGAG